MTDSFERALGKHSNYYAIDGGEWPPRHGRPFTASEGNVVVAEAERIIATTVTIRRPTSEKGERR